MQWSAPEQPGAGSPDLRVLAEHIATALAEVRRDDAPEVQLMGLMDAVAAALPDGGGAAARPVADAREHLRRLAVRRAHSLAPVPASTAVGQAFADLLLLGALACQAPVALLSVPQADGRWSTLSHGLDSREGTGDRLLFDAVAHGAEPVEFPDLTVAWSRSPLVAPPHNLRWAYGVALRDHGGELTGVVAVADRGLRRAGRREQRALQALARCAGDHLVRWRRPREGAGLRQASPDAAAAERVTTPSAALGGLRRTAGLRDGQQLLRSHEVAVLFDVTERTVINWASAGKLPSLRTMGGHLRFRSEDVLGLLAGRDVAAGGSAR